MIINGAWILAIAFLYCAWRFACWIERRREDGSERLDATDRENGSRDDG